MTTTLQRIRASRGEPCWPCFQAELTGMYHRLRRAEDVSMNEPFPLEWVVQPCTWGINNTTLLTKCMYCSDKPADCARVPALLEGNFKDLMDTIDYFRVIISARGGSPTGYALTGSAQTNVIKSLVKLAVAFDDMVNYHKDEHTMRGLTQEALKPYLEKYQLKFDERRQNLATGVLQCHTYPDDGLVRLTRDDDQFYVWSSRVYEFYDDLASGLELGLVPEEEISTIVAHIPIVRPYASNPLPNAFWSELDTLMNRHWEELSRVGGDDHTNDQGGPVDSGFRDRDRVTASPNPLIKEEPART